MLLIDINNLSCAFFKPHLAMAVYCSTSLHAIGAKLVHYFLNQIRLPLSKLDSVRCVSLKTALDLKLAHLNVFCLQCVTLSKVLPIFICCSVVGFNLFFVCFTSVV